MIFLDPKNDMVFKKLFADNKHKGLLINFLNSVLGRPEGEKIIDVTIEDPHNMAETPGTSKASIVDIRCTDQSKNHYIVEMQVIDQNDFEARAQYYSSLLLSRQLREGEKYHKLVPVIFVGILDFNLFKSENYLSHHFILNSETHEHALKHLEFHFIELKKFNNTLEELKTEIDQWIYFFKHATSLQKIPGPLKNPVLQEAFDILEQGSWSKKDLDAYDRYLDNIRSAAGQLDAAFDKGIRKAKREIAKNFLDILDVETIAQKTGLSVAEVEALKKK